MPLIKSQVKVESPFGLHARPATVIVTMINASKSTVRIIDLTSDTEVNGRSVISLLSLGAAQGTDVLLEIDGPDAEDLNKKLVDYFQLSFGEK